MFQRDSIKFCSRISSRWLCTRWKGCRLESRYQLPLLKTGKGTLLSVLSVYQKCCLFSVASFPRQFAVRIPFLSHSMQYNSCRGMLALVKFMYSCTRSQRSPDGISKHLKLFSFVPRPSPSPAFDRLQAICTPYRLCSVYTACNQKLEVEKAWERVGVG